MPAILRSRWFWLALLALIVAGVIGVVMSRAGAASREREAEAAAAPPPESPYAAIANGKADVEGGIIQVAARRGGIVRSVLVQEGDRVARGQILARQEDDAERLAVQRARAELAQAQSQVAALQVQLDAARREYERMERLAATNYVAAQRLDQARDGIRSAEAALNAQLATIGTVRARLNETLYNLELTVIRAPASGRIVRRHANPGSGASTLNVSNMFELEPDAPRIVRAEIPESALPNVVEGQQVEITAEADPSRVFVGRVIRRAGMFGARRLQSDDPTERTDERVVEVVVAAENAPLLIGQRVLVKFMKPGQQAGAVRTPPAPAAEAGERPNPPAKT